MIMVLSKRRNYLYSIYAYILSYYKHKLQYVNEKYIQVFVGKVPTRAFFIEKHIIRDF